MNRQAKLPCEQHKHHMMYAEREFVVIFRRKLMINSLSTRPMLTTSAGKHSVEMKRIFLCVSMVSTPGNRE